MRLYTRDDAQGAFIGPWIAEKYKGKNVAVLVNDGHDRAHHDLVGDGDLRDVGRVEDRLDLTDARLHHALVVLGGVVVGVLPQVTVRARFGDALLRRGTRGVAAAFEHGRHQRRASQSPVTKRPTRRHGEGW